MKAKREANLHEIRTTDRARHAADPSKKRAAARRHHEANRDKILAKNRSPEGLARQREYERRKRRERPDFRVHSNMSKAIRNSLKDKGGRSWEAILGYTTEQLMVHLERQFIRGMTWENYGPVWEVDHIVPKASFSFASQADEGFQRCWAISNLRPLWAEANRKKSGNRTHLL
jgi:hypothetical protein